MGNRVFVGNLPWDTTEEELQKHLGGDTVEKVKIIIDRDTGRSKGFAFVDMVSDAAAAEVIESLNGATFGGRSLRLDAATERPARPSFGGAGRESRGGYGGGEGRGQRGGGSRRSRDDW